MMKKTGTKSKKQTKTPVKPKQPAKRNSLIDNPVIKRWLIKTAWQPCIYKDIFSRHLYLFCQTLRRHKQYNNRLKQDIMIPCWLPFQSGETRQLKISDYENIFDYLITGTGKSFTIPTTRKEYENTYLTPLMQKIITVQAETNERINEIILAETSKLQEHEHNFVNKRAGHSMLDFYEDNPYKDYLPELPDSVKAIKRSQDGKLLSTEKNFTQIEANINLSLHLMDAFRKTSKKIRIKDEKLYRINIIKNVIQDIVFSVYPEGSREAIGSTIMLNHRTYIKAIDKRIDRAEKNIIKAYTVTSLADFLPTE